MLFISVTLLSFLSLVNSTLFPNIYPRLKLSAKPTKDTGDPLIITPYLLEGSILVAQNLSRVSLTDQFKIQSHAGFFTINKKYNSNLYFWYFRAHSNNASAPVILWLQGGPGCSSLYGLFKELGPLKTVKGKFFLRKYHWAQNYHLIFIDSPVGSGFSFTENSGGYCSNQECVSIGLYNALQQFFELFPDLRKNEFFITGESYAGKYIPSLALVIHREGHKSNINLKGLAMGNAYCDPLNQLDYGNYLYQHGLLDRNQLKIFLDYQIDIYVLIKNEKWLQANILMDRLMSELYKFYTGYDNYYNCLRTAAEENMRAFAFMSLIDKDDVRRSIHVGGREFQDGQTVQLFLTLDIMKSVAPAICELLSHYRIMFYNGQLDVIVAYPLTVNFLSTIKFSASEEYSKAKRNIWRVGNDIAGYVKSAGNLTEVLVRNAGHMVPKDQPEWALDLITRFINNDLNITSSSVTLTATFSP